MKNKITVLLCLVLAIQVGFGQESSEWKSDYDFKLSDFNSPQTEINKNLKTISIFPATTVELNFVMSYYKFMFTKNFNSKITALFDPKAAIISAPDSIVATRLLRLANYNFDLCELYARKIRKKIFEDKKTFSSIEMLQTYYHQKIKDFNAEGARVFKLTEMGVKAEILEEEHQKVRQQIEALADFCKTCKPKKKKKKRSQTE